MRFSSPPSSFLVSTCVVVVGILFARALETEASCLELIGIESGGGDNTLDLDELIGNLEDNAFEIGRGPLVASSCLSEMETPIAMRHILGYELAYLSANNMFQETALDVFGEKETSDARRRCQPETDDDVDLFELHQRVTGTYVIVYGSLLGGVPDCEEELETVMADSHLPLSYVLDGGNTSIDTPWGLAKAYVDEIYAYMDENDGWNADGSLSRDHNRVPFSDYPKTDSAGNTWTPYMPKNTPYHFTEKNNWQPLMESDGLGYITTQEHVVPHIGATARFFGFNSTADEEAFAARKVADPAYTYNQAADDVIEESLLMATDDYKKAAISFFDDKGASLLPLKVAFYSRSLVNETRSAFARATAESQLAIYNGVILSWKEKIYHDLPRPPTVVTDQLGDTLVEAYDSTVDGVETMKASEWEPFIRTMPHSEFPSASACMCEAFTKQLELLTGADTIDPVLEFPGANGIVFEFSSWSDISSVCGDSRVWGGMHFPEAVPAGADLCGDEHFTESISANIGRLMAGDETAAVLKRDPGELMVRPIH